MVTKKCPQCKTSIKKVKFDIGYGIGVESLHCKKCGFNMTENNVMAKLRSEFSSIFSEWFETLSPENLSVRLDENFTPIITNQDYDIEYDFLSGGERTAVALAYRLSLNKVGVTNATSQRPKF